MQRLSSGKIWDRLKTMGNKNGNFEGDPKLKETDFVKFFVLKSKLSSFILKAVSKFPEVRDSIY